MSRVLHRLVALALSAALAGCGSTLLLDAPPAAPTLGITATDTFAAAPADATAPTEADLRWWNRFNDPALAGWVERALTNSPDTAIARERICGAACVRPNSPLRLRCCRPKTWPRRHACPPLASPPVPMWPGKRPCWMNSCSPMD
jgi:predicted small lipoprotein YifL